ncbi:RNA polymerase sigma-70 factor (ECF subfamily) [Mucilaginibacter oryzae]|uniref:RNA polymerase sigma-70 factor (ECF subfamily) n=1 Tax=Mucilaginibacter oryzae TaxID=468058 RepID=A0A316HEA5_9SPHI|nr:RNA polymerase sigma-70 factor [Mucilaginibacter oryzae]PWK79549.1 RNA polymerase sigma-70 factor (ECF subfamily) [Mucilaginibacter oryzae]
MADKDLPDHILLKKLRDDDLKAYDAIFFRYFRKIHAFARSSVRDDETAKELAMDVMIRLWQKRGSILVETDLNAYLYRSIRNALYNNWKRKAIITLPISDLPESFEPISQPADHELDCKELQQSYQEKLNQLSPQRKQVFTMSREQNMSYAEIADHLNLSVNTVRNHVSASLQYFREHLNEFAALLLPVILLITAFKK